MDARTLCYGDIVKNHNWILRFQGISSRNGDLYALYLDPNSPVSGVMAMLEDPSIMPVEITPEFLDANLPEKWEKYPGIPAWNNSIFKITKMSEDGFTLSNYYPMVEFVRADTAEKICIPIDRVGAVKHEEDKVIAEIDGEETEVVGPFEEIVKTMREMDRKIDFEFYGKIKYVHQLQAFLRMIGNVDAALSLHV